MIQIKICVYYLFFYKMTLIIYNDEQIISIEQYFSLLQTNSYKNVKAVFKEKNPDFEKNILVDNEQLITDQFDIFVQAVKTIATLYQRTNDNHYFNLNDTVLAFNKVVDITTLNRESESLCENLAKIQFAMNNKHSYYFPKNEKDYFQMYSVSFELVLFILNSQLKNPNAMFGHYFDNCL